MARDERLICASADLPEGGKGVRFALTSQGGEEKGFVIRHRGSVHAYVNICPHAGTELDWQPGEFFDIAGLYLVCATHGAVFQPEDGYCIAGPCQGASLARLQACERDGQVLLLNDPSPPTKPETPAR